MPTVEITDWGDAIFLALSNALNTFLAAIPQVIGAVRATTTDAQLQVVDLLQRPVRLCREWTRHRRIEADARAGRWQQLPDRGQLGIVGQEGVHAPHHPTVGGPRLSWTL